MIKVDLTTKTIKENLYFRSIECLSRSIGKFEVYTGTIDIDKIRSITKLSDDIYAIATDQWDNKLQHWIFKGETNLFD